MFINKNKLSHLLQPHHYREEDFYETELKKIFLPGWHLVGAKSELPKPGDFVTRELLDRPLLIRNCDGEIRTFLNVCGHRHSRLTSKIKGNAPKLVCQYHGWEYKSDGSTAKIPEAKCFRPFDRENTRLCKIRTETRGELIFVSFDENGKTLEEFLGKHVDDVVDWFGPRRFQFIGRIEWSKNANWKVSVENTLESYHVPVVHPNSIGTHPKEEKQTHKFGGGFSTLITEEPPRFNRWLQTQMMRVLGVKSTYKYTHHLVYPNIVLLELDPMVMAQVYVPTSHNTHRWDGYVFARKPGRWFGNAFFGLTKLITMAAAKKVVKEDLQIIDQIQLGLNASPHPGVIGTIEERVYAFQQFVLNACGENAPKNEFWNQRRFSQADLNKSSN